MMIINYARDGEGKSASRCERTGLMIGVACARCPRYICHHGSLDAVTCADDAVLVRHDGTGFVRIDEREMIPVSGKGEGAE